MQLSIKVTTTTPSYLCKSIFVIIYQLPVAFQRTILQKNVILTPHFMIVTERNTVINMSGNIKNDTMNNKFGVVPVPTAPLPTDNAETPPQQQQQNKEKKLHIVFIHLDLGIGGAEQLKILVIMSTLSRPDAIRTIALLLYNTQRNQRVIFRLMFMYMVDGSHPTSWVLVQPSCRHYE
jgi:hypothetical protein